MQGHRRVLRSIALATVASFACGHAYAQPAGTTEEARADFESGTAAFDAGDYDLAVSQFQLAYDATQHPDILFNIYSAAERAGDLERAQEALARYLREGEVEPDRRPVLQTRLARLRERIAAQAAEPDPETASVRDPARDPAHAADADPERTPPPDESGGGVHPAGIGVLAAGGALLVSFAVFAALSEVEDGNLAQGCGATASCGDADLEALNAFNVVADVSWIGGAALAVTGLVLLFVLPPEGADSASATLAPWATPDAAGLGAVGRF